MTLYEATSALAIVFLAYRAWAWRRCALSMLAETKRYRDEAVAERNRVRSRSENLGITCAAVLSDMERATGGRHG